MNNNIKIPGLEAAIVKNIDYFEDRISIHVEFPIQTHKCPGCGGRTRRVHDYRIPKVKYLKWFERLCYIFYRKGRYKCGECGKRFYEKNSIINRYKRFSKEWNQAVNIRSVKTKTFKETAQQFGASTSTIIRRFDEIAKRELKDIEQLPRVIAIDEYKGDTKEGKYQLIIANGKTKEPIDILPNRRKRTIVNDLRKYGANIEIVIMDMSPSFKAAVEKALNNR